MNTKTLLTAALFALVSTGAYAQAGAPTCRAGDRLIELADGALKCWEAGQPLPDGAEEVADGHAGDATPPPDAGEFSFAAWAKAAENCLKEEGAFSPAPGSPGCYVGQNGMINCTSQDYGDTAMQCSAEANAGGQPARWTDG